MNRLTMERAIEESPLDEKLIPQAAEPRVRGMPVDALGATTFLNQLEERNNGLYLLRSKAHSILLPVGARLILGIIRKQSVQCQVRIVAVLQGSY